MVLSFPPSSPFSVAGYVYFRSSRARYKEAERDSALQAERIRNGVSSFLAENLKTARALAGLREMREVLSDPRGPSLARVNAVLDHFRDALAADVCYLMDRGGTTVASSKRERRDSLWGNNFAFRPYWIQAIRGIPATYMAQGVTSNLRGVYFSHPGTATRAVPPSRRGDQGLDGAHRAGARQGSDGIASSGPKGIVFAGEPEGVALPLLLGLTQEDVEEVARSQQFGPGPWEWSGLSILGSGKAPDKSGMEYRFSRLDVSAYPGWSVVYLDDCAPYPGRSPARCSAPRARSFCSSALIGLSVLVLYRRASGDIVRRKAAEEALQEAQKKLTQHSEELSAR